MHELRVGSIRVPGVGSRLRVTATSFILLEILLYVILGLTPLLWFSHGQIITGGDIDYPLDPIGRLHDRIFAWNALFLGGNDRSLDVSTLFYSFVEAVGFVITHSVVLSEKFSFVFWFTSAGLAMAFFLNTAFPHRRILRIAGVIFYMFNFYEFYNWEIARIGEISATVEAPLLFAAITAVARGSLAMRRVALLVGFASLVGMGIGVQPPALYAMIISLSSYWVFELFAAAYGRDKAAVRRLLGAAFVIPATFCAVNATWLLPEINFIVSSGYTDSSHGIDVFDVASLLEWTSRKSSIFDNLFIAGRIVFYDTWGGEPYIPGIYGPLTTPWFRALGMIVPITTFGALFVTRERRAWYFAVLALATVFLSKGTHPPFPDFYPFLIKHIPGLWVIRAPWEKFALATTIAYAVLMGISIEALAAFAISRMPAVPRKAVGAAVVSGAAAAIIAFHYPLVLGDSFPGVHGAIRYPGFHQTIPMYAMEAADWVSTLPDDVRILPLPDDRVSVYNWGYAAPLDITVRLFARTIIDRQYGEGTAPPQPADQTYNELVTAIANGDSVRAQYLLHYFRISYILQRNDIRYRFYHRGDSPATIARELKRIPGLHIVKRFGAWDFYRYSPTVPAIYAASNLVVVEHSFSNVSADLIPPRPDSAVVVDGLSVGGIRSSISDVRSTIPIIAPFPLHSVASIPVSQRIAELSVPIDQTARVSARFFPGSKAVVSTVPDDPATTLIANARSPYSFPNADKAWSANDSTLVFIETGNRAVSIEKILDGLDPIGDVIGIAWQSGWAGFVTHPMTFPVVVPPHQTAIVQVNHHVSGDLTVVGSTSSWTVPVEQPGFVRSDAGFRSNATALPAATILARFEPGQVALIGDNLESNSPFAIRSRPGYRFWQGATAWTAAGSTIVSIQTGSAPVRVNGFQEGVDNVRDLVGMAFGSNWIGFGSRPVAFPVMIPPHTHAVAQINHRVEGSLVVLGDGNGWRVDVAQPGDRGEAPGAPLMARGTAVAYLEHNGTYTFRLCSARPLSTVPRLVVDKRSTKLIGRADVGRCHGYMFAPLRLSAGEHGVSVDGVHDGLSGAVAFLTSGPIAEVRSVRFVRESPVQLSVNSDVRGEYLLVFGDNYNAGWRLYAGRKTFWQILTSRPLQRSPVLVNGFANGWLVRQSAPTAYTLFFWPQVLLAAGFSISAISLIFLLVNGARPELTWRSRRRLEGARG